MTATNLTRSRLPAKRVLEEAKRNASKNVIVISQGKDGDLYFATSMPSNSPQNLEAQMKLVNEGLKMLRRIHRTVSKQEAQP